MIKAIIFDFGNVISRVNNHKTLMTLSRYSDMPIAELDRIMFGSGLQKEYESGKMSSDEFFRETALRCRLNCSKEEFVIAYTDIFTPIKTTWELILNLKNNRSHYKIGLLSNTSELDFVHGIKKTAIFPLFDSITLSFEVGVMKPSEEIYRDSLNKLKVHPEEAIFIDDLQENVDGAEKIGMRGVRYADHKPLIEFLEKIGVKL